jgi:hypothetical protein
MNEQKAKLLDVANFVRHEFMIFLDFILPEKAHPNFVFSAIGLFALLLTHLNDLLR